MSVDGRDESHGDGDAEARGPASPQVPSQGGRAGFPQGGELPEGGGIPAQGGEPVEAGIPAQGGEPVEGTVPAQRDRRDDGVLPPLWEGAPSDADLIARMRAGDDSAYEELYRRHAAAVRRYARTCCRDAHTADDLTAEVFARMLQAVRGGAGPEQAVRAYLLTTVRRVAAGWTKSAKREHLVDDFAVFAAQSARGPQVSDDGAQGLGADVRAMHEAERSLAMQAFRSLPERWQAVLWHTEVEDESPSEVATLFGLDANGTRVLASRAREGLKQAYLQAHVSASLAGDRECARYADRLGAYARGSLRSRAERGLRKHLDECVKCRLAAGQIKEVAGGIPAVVPVAVIGWLGAAGYAKVLGLIAGSAGAGVAGAVAATSGTGAAGGGAVGGGGAGAGGGAAASEGLGAAVKAGVAAGVVAVGVAAVVVIALGAGEGGGDRPDAKPPVSSPIVQPAQDTPTPTPTRNASEPSPPAIAAGPGDTPAVTDTQPSAPAPTAPHGTPPDQPTGTAPTATPTATPTQAPEPSSTPTSEPTSKPTPTPTPTPPPVPVVYPLSDLDYDVHGDGTGPEIRLRASSWLWQRYGMSIAGRPYANGATVHGESSVTVDLNRRCSSYDALVGIDDLTLKPGKAHFSVYADGVRLWKSGLLKSGEPAQPVHVSLAGRRTVRLVVEPHGHLGKLTLADWAEAKFTCT
ncbi:sigma-70 family RNA polymerase sigma factor [Streptomyces sp. HUCO-GS316]|uniref:sigma-70 family RNA polymerase sigma factor n=1 Tax=Streptomyces sp. HUCO-GS316 TaxID=2692198 RepID=UPI00136FA7D9|nr:sigma-70 family RNA polymerase sigma factor [Streptomyces sp. HUCO-GS316]MXM68462.1 sigma-70 family RNA polymerase sigma factor [Streptomyces sp. HUCO-GS316]